MTLGNSKKVNVFLHLAAICYALILFGFNFVRIFDDNFWLDEAFSINLARMSFGEMLKTTAADVHPPLYYAFLMLMRHLFGDYGWLFHLTSIIPYAIVMIFILSVIRRSFGKETAFLMITFVSMMRSSIVYNVEVRMYSLAAMFVLFVFYNLYLIFKDNKLLNYFLFGFFSVCALYTHYCTMVPVIVLYLFLLAFTIVKKRKILRIFTLSTVAAYAPWMGIFISTFKRTTESFERDYISPARGLVYFFWLRQEWYALIIWLFFAVAVILLVFYKIKGRKKEESLRYFLFEIRYDTFWLAGGVAASIGTLLTYEAASFLIRPCFSYKYLHPVIALLWLVFSVVLSKIRYGKKIMILLAVITFFAALPMYSEIYETDSVSAERSDKTKQLISESMGKDDVLFTNIESLEWAVLQYYFPDKQHHLSGNIEEIYDFAKEAPGLIFWSEELNQEKLQRLAEQKYKIELKCSSCVLGETEFYLYYIEKL